MTKSGKRIAGVVFFALAGLMLLSAPSALAKGPDISRAEGVGYLVGVFILPLGAIIVGLWLFLQPSDKEDDSERQKRRR